VEGFYMFFEFQEYFFLRLAVDYEITTPANVAATESESQATPTYSRAVGGGSFLLLYRPVARGRNNSSRREVHRPLREQGQEREGEGQQERSEAEKQWYHN
jgi:hypothetical protein